MTDQKLVEVPMPSVAESITDGQVLEWHHAEGDFVKEDDVLVTIETAKINAEVTAPVSGILKSIKKAAEEWVEIGELLAIMEPADAPAEGASPAPASEPAPKAPAEAPSADAKTMPAARRMIEEKGLDASKIEATGGRGHVTKADVVDHLEAGKKASAAPSAAPTATPAATPAAAAMQEERVPMSPLRRMVAQRLLQAQHNAAILTTFNEVDMSNIMAIRQRYQDSFVKRYDIKLGFMSFFVKACVDALKAFPAVNAEIDGTDIVYKNYQHIGVAVGGGRGLVVPVVRNAEGLSFSQIELEIRRLALLAKDNKLTMDDLTGGTFTISNGGIYGSMLSTPILNPPQTAILGMHNIIERPVAVNGEVVVRPMMYLALSYDHRLIDGREAVQFLIRVKDCVENPERMLLEV